MRKNTAQIKKDFVNWIAQYEGKVSERHVQVVEMDNNGTTELEVVLWKEREKLYFSIQPEGFAFEAVKEL